MTTIAETGKKLQDVTNSVVSKLVGGAEAVPPTPPPTNESALVALATPRPRRGPAAPSASTAPAATVAPPVAVVTPSPAAPPEPDAPSTPAPPPQPFVDSGIYSASDAAVEAPVLVYPQLPSKPIDGALFTRPSELDLLVLEDGTVAEARLIPQSDRLQDRMMVSAAKAWRFRPAEKDGKPVRYRMRIPITW
jgi:protein TonB